MEDYEERKKKWYLDVRHTPCARNALLYGILVGGVSGILYYFKSGVVRRSCDFAVGGFAVISFVIWEVCRYQKAKLRSDIKRTVDILNHINETKNSQQKESEIDRN